MAASLHGVQKTGEIVTEETITHFVYISLLQRCATHLPDDSVSNLVHAVRTVLAQTILPMNRAFSQENANLKETLFRALDQIHCQSNAYTLAGAYPTSVTYGPGEDQGQKHEINTKRIFLAAQTLTRTRLLPWIRTVKRLVDEPVTERYNTAGRTLNSVISGVLGAISNETGHRDWRPGFAKAVVMEVVMDRVGSPGLQGDAYRNPMIYDGPKSTDALAEYINRSEEALEAAVEFQKSRASIGMILPSNNQQAYARLVLDGNLRRPPGLCLDGSETPIFFLADSWVACTPLKLAHLLVHAVPFTTIGRHPSKTVCDSHSYDCHSKNTRAIRIFTLLLELENILRWLRAQPLLKGAKT